MGVWDLAGGEAGHVDPVRLAEPADTAARLSQVLVDVGAQCLQRRDIDDANFIGQRRDTALADQVVDRRQKRGERLAGPGWRGDERVSAGSNRNLTRPKTDAPRVPAAALRRCGLTKRFQEPTRNERMEAGQHDQKDGAEGCPGS